MITASDLDLLRGLTNTKPRAVKLETGKALVYSSWFAIEIPLKDIDPSYGDWEETVPEGARHWRSRIPVGVGEYAQGIRWTNPEDGVTLVKLLSDSSKGMIHAALYDFVRRRIIDPEFRLFEGEQSIVAIYSEGVHIGAVAQVQL